MTIIGYFGASDQDQEVFWGNRALEAVIRFQVKKPTLKSCSEILFFFLFITALSCQNGHTEEFQNVAYSPTVYKTGAFVEKPSIISFNNEIQLVESMICISQKNMTKQF